MNFFRLAGYLEFIRIRNSHAWSTNISAFVLSYGIRPSNTTKIYPVVFQRCMAWEHASYMPEFTWNATGNTSCRTFFYIIWAAHYRLLSAHYGHYLSPGTPLFTSCTLHMQTINQYSTKWTKYAHDAHPTVSSTRSTWKTLASQMQLK